MIFRSNATSFLCECLVSFRSLIFYTISPLKFACAALKRFLHWSLMDLLVHYTQMDGVKGTWLLLSYGMDTFAVKVAVRAC